MENMDGFHRKIKDFLQKVYDYMEMELKDGAVEGHFACGSYETKDGWIEIEMHSNGENHVDVFHNNEEEHECHNLAELICDNLPDWDKVYDICMKEAYEEEEFRQYVMNIH